MDPPSFSTYFCVKKFNKFYGCRIIRGDGNQMVLPQPLSGSKIDSAVSVKSPTSAKKSDQELFPSGNAYVNTSTPMINPDAVNSQDKILSAGPVPQPKQEPLLNFPVYANKENVGAKPDKLVNDSPNNEAPAQVLRAPGKIYYHNSKIVYVKVLVIVK